MKKPIGTIELMPTPQGYVDSLLLIYNDSPKPDDRKWAREELINAMRIAYAYHQGKTHPEYKMDGIEGKPRICYFVMETQTNEKGEYRALIANDNDKGKYNLTDWYWGKDFKEAQRIADEKNLAMGITKQEATIIQLRSMRK